MGIPSKKSIKAYFSQWFDHEGLDHDVAASAIRAAMESGKPWAALETINRLLDAHGVESIYNQGRPDDSGAYYVNTGDTYNGTVLYDVQKRTFMLTTYGDWVERQERRGRHF